MGVESGQESDLQIQPGEAGGGCTGLSAASREKVTLNQESS